MPLDINSNVSVGTSPQTAGDTFSGNLRVNGVMTYAGGLTANGQQTLSKATQYTVGVTDSGFVITTGSATTAVTFTLPTASGVAYTFMYTGANGGAAMNISPQTADKIVGLNSAGVADKDMILSAATARYGDYIRIEWSAATTWAITDAAGVWSREG